MSKATAEHEASHQTPPQTEKQSATKEWVEAHINYTALDDDDESLAESESIAESSIVDSTDYESDESDGLSSSLNAIKVKALGTNLSSNDLSTLTELFDKVNTVQTLGNVSIENSTGVHIGNITNINGNIQIIHTGSSRRHRKEKNKPNATENNENTPCEEREERNPQSAFIAKTKFKPAKGLCPIIPRHMWVAQRPLEPYDPLPEPTQYVVILHTATESSEKQAINIRIVRDVQCFHIESRGWNDIAYNFLIGGDGNVYEGRGWGVVGAHTMGYNVISLGIAFIGCFMRELPTKSALDACKNLLKRGVDEGHIDPNYHLFGASQCRPTENPGRRLIEEIKTWDHFYRIENEVNNDAEKEASES